MSSERPLGRIRGITAVTAAVCVAWSAFLALYSNGSTTQLVSNLGLMAVALGAGIQALARAPRGRAHGPGVGLLGLSCLSWGCGQAAWTWYESVLGREVPFPSIADIGYLLFVPLAAAALLAFPSVPRRLSSRIRTVLDGLLIACALLFMSWMLVLGPLFDAGGDRLTLTIGLAYPLGDVVIITILLFASSHRSQQASSSGASRPLLFAGLLAFAIADSCFVYLTNSGCVLLGQPHRHRVVLRVRGDLPRRNRAGLHRGRTTEHGRRRARPVRGARAVRAGRPRGPPRRDPVGGLPAGSGASSDGTCWPF